MKVKVISRNPDHYQRETKNDIFKVPQRNGGREDPLRHAVEYTRALNAAKLDRVFAKPFVGSFEGHNEGVHVLTKHPLRLGTILSGARDGQVKIWRLSNRKCLATVQAHNGPVHGVSVDGVTGEMFASIGQDSQIKLWNLPEQFSGGLGDPVHSVALDHVPHSISHIYNSSDFVISGEGVSVWKIYRDSPVRTYDVGTSTVHSVRCNPVEPTVFAGCAHDRSVFILDTREKVPLTRLVMSLRTNAIAWNPVEAFTFAAASDDYNVYTFDMRNLSAAKIVHHDHVAAVLDIDYSPTGKEFVTGSADRSLRIFRAEGHRSREIYTTPRMQQVMSVLWTLDNKYVLSGSNEFNVRLWKANASEKMGVLRPREKAAMEYNNTLKNQYSAHPKVAKIIKHRQVPKSIYAAAKEHQIIKEKKARKLTNIEKHSKPGTVSFVSERKEKIVKTGFD